MDRQIVRYALWMVFALGLALFLIGVVFMLLAGRVVSGALFLPFGLILIVFSLLMIRVEKKNRSLT